jgi:hypothetical protein
MVCVAALRMAMNGWDRAPTPRVVRPWLDPRLRAQLLSQVNHVGGSFHSGVSWVVLLRHSERRVAGPIPSVKTRAVTSQRYHPCDAASDAATAFDHRIMRREILAMRLFSQRRRCEQEREALGHRAFGLGRARSSHCERCRWRNQLVGCMHTHHEGACFPCQSWADYITDASPRTSYQFVVSEFENPTRTAHPRANRVLSVRPE